MVCSSLNHWPRSTSLQRFEQNGPKGVANQSPAFLHDGHLMLVGTLMAGELRLDETPANPVFRLKRCSQDGIHS